MSTLPRTTSRGHFPSLLGTASPVHYLVPSLGASKTYFSGHFPSESAILPSLQNFVLISLGHPVAVGIELSAHYLISGNLQPSGVRGFPPGQLRRQGPVAGA